MVAVLRDIYRDTAGAVTPGWGASATSMGAVAGVLLSRPSLDGEPEGSSL